MAQRKPAQPPLHRLFLIAAFTLGPRLAVEALDGLATDEVVISLADDDDVPVAAPDEALDHAAAEKPAAARDADALVKFVVHPNTGSDEAFAPRLNWASLPGASPPERWVVEALNCEAGYQLLGQELRQTPMEAAEIIVRLRSLSEIHQVGRPVGSKLLTRSATAGDGRKGGC